MMTSALILSIVLAASTMVSANFYLRASTPQDKDEDTDASLDWHRHKKHTPSILSIVLAASTTVNANFHLRASTPQGQVGQDDDTSLDWYRHHKKKKTNPVVPNGKWGFMGAAITITHVSDDETNLDEEKVSQTFMKAYNTVHDNGYRITTGFIENKVVIPESTESSNLDFSTVIYYYPFGYDYPNCPAEFGLSGEAQKDSLEATAKPKPADDSKVHEEFVSYFLKALRSSDMAAFADIEAVRIAFTYTDPTTTTTTTTVMTCVINGLRGPVDEPKRDPSLQSTAIRHYIQWNFSNCYELFWNSLF